MHRFSKLGIFVCTLTLGWLALSPVIFAAEPGPLGVVLQPLVDEHVMAGAVVLVADKEKVLDLEAIGFSSLETHVPMRTDSLFWIASMTKSFTATALMMLVDEGKLNVHDPVEKYLPEFKGQMVVEEGGAKHLPRRPITIVDVLSHTSGLVTPQDPTVKRVNSIKDDVAQYGAAALLREPGTKYQYNNTGIETAGRIVEVVSGVPYAEFMQQRLLGPLGLKDTTFWPSEEQAARLAHTARFTEDKSALEDLHFEKGITPAFIAKFDNGVPFPHRLMADYGGSVIADYAKHYALPAGGLYSTAEDVGRFCQMLLNGGTYGGRQYVSEAAIKEMTADQTREIMVSPQEAYGLGWSVKKKEDEGPSVGSYGHRGARRTVMWVDPAHGLVMVMMLQRHDLPGADQDRLYQAFMKTAVARWGKAP